MDNFVIYIIILILCCLIFSTYEKFTNYYGTSCYLSCTKDDGTDITDLSKCTLCGADNQQNCTVIPPPDKITIPDLLATDTPEASYLPLVCGKSPIKWLK